MGEVGEIKMEEFPGGLNIFAYNSFSNKKFPIFKNTKDDDLNVKFENQKYS